MLDSLMKISNDAMPRNKRSFFAIILLSLWGILIYSNSFNSSFHYDDYVSIVDNPDVQWKTISFENFKKLFVADIQRPFSFLTFALNYYFGGLDVRGFHYVNIGIHIISSIGLFLFTKSMLELPFRGRGLRERSLSIAFIAALFWLSSPIQTQAVTYIVQRMAALAAMFYIFAMYFYLKARTDSRRRYLFYTLTLMSSFLALGSKENAYVLPLFLLLFEIIIIRRGDAAFLLNKRALSILAVLAVAFIGLIWYLFYEPFRVDIGSWFPYWIKTRFLTGMRVICFYIIQLLFPVPSRLSIEHYFSFSRGLLDPPSTLFALIVISGLILSALAFLKKYPLFSFCTLWFFGNLAIETFYPYLILVFEHRVYLPSMGFFVLAALGVDYLIEFSRSKRLLWFSVSAVIVIFALFSINTYIRNGTWGDEYSLWSDVVAKNPSIASGYIGLGSAFAKDEDYQQALTNYIKANSLDPRNPAVLYGLGLVYFKLHEYDDAVRYFSIIGSTGYIGIGNSPSISYYFSRIAKNYYGHRRTKEALAVLDRALLYDPNETMLKELKEKMEKGTITSKEIMQND